jgi:hypothetical protein
MLKKTLSLGTWAAADKRNIYPIPRLLLPAVRAPIFPCTRYTVR